MDPLKIREDFPSLRRMIKGKPLIYFDNAATTHKPLQVLNSIHQFYLKYNSAINRSLHEGGGIATGLWIEAHENIARFIGAGSWREIVITRNSTEAVNLVCYSLLNGREGGVRIGPGDEVIVSVMEHHSNFVPWQRLAGHGLTVRIAPVNEEGFIDAASLKSLINGSTRLICCSHVSNVLGSINPIGEISAMARQAGALLLVDGTQSAPHLKINVKDMECDFFALSGHKMLAPAGTGVLYGKRGLLENMEPFMSGGGMIRDVSPERSTWNDLPWKFEAGTPDVAGAVALGGATEKNSRERLFGAVDYLETLGMEAVHDHESALSSLLLWKLREREDIVIYGPEPGAERCGIISFNIRKNRELADPAMIAYFLDEEGIAVRGGSHCAHPLMKSLGIEGTLRVSLYIYNTRDEVERFVRVLFDIIDNKIL